MNVIEKITNFQKIKAMDIDKMVEFFTQEYDSDFGDGYCISRICYDCKLYTTCDKFKENLKQWLESEVRE